MNLKDLTDQEFIKLRAEILAEDKARDKINLSELKRKLDRFAAVLTLPVTIDLRVSFNYLLFFNQEYVDFRSLIWSAEPELSYMRQEDYDYNRKPSELLKQAVIQSNELQPSLESARNLKKEIQALATKLNISYSAAFVKIKEYRD